jgi:hypothetical protein
MFSFCGILDGSAGSSENIHGLLSMGAIGVTEDPAAILSVPARFIPKLIEQEGLRLRRIPQL